MYLCLMYVCGTETPPRGLASCGGRTISRPVVPTTLKFGLGIVAMCVCVCVCESLLSFMRSCEQLFATPNTLSWTETPPRGLASCGGRTISRPVVPTTLKFGLGIVAMCVCVCVCESLLSFMRSCEQLFATPNTLSWAAPATRPGVNLEAPSVGYGYPP